MFQFINKTFEPPKIAIKSQCEYAYMNFASVKDFQINVYLISRTTTTFESRATAKLTIFKHS